MSGRHHERSTEALSRLPHLDLAELRELWYQLYKTETAPRLSRELLMRAVAYRMQEVASGGPRLELQRQLREIGLELQQTGRLRIRPRLKPGTRLMRAISSARSTAANLPRKASSRNSTRSQRSARLARPISAASSTRVGPWRKPATTTAGSRVAIWSGQRCSICSPTSGLVASTSWSFTRSTG